MSRLARQILVLCLLGAYALVSGSGIALALAAGNGPVPPRARITFWRRVDFPGNDALPALRISRARAVTGLYPGHSVPGTCAPSLVPSTGASSQQKTPLLVHAPCSSTLELDTRLSPACAPGLRSISSVGRQLEQSWKQAVFASAPRSSPRSGSMTCRRSIIGMAHSWDLSTRGFLSFFEE